MVDILQSGGCYGGDFVFDDCAKKAGHQIRHYSFLNHHLDTKGNAIILNEIQLMMADPYLRRANETLKRRIPRATNMYVMKLLQRNYFQIKDSERVYAVAPFAENGTVGGGTGWAVQMAIDQHIPEIYLFDNHRHYWHYYDHSFHSRMWRSMLDKPPKPHGTYTGIGSRELTKEGEAAIRSLYDISNK